MKKEKAKQSVTPREQWQAADPRASEEMAEADSPRVAGRLRDLAKALLVPLFRYLDTAGMPIVERHALVSMSMRILTKHCQAVLQPHLLVEEDIEEKVEWAVLEAFTEGAALAAPSSASQAAEAP